MAEPHVLPRTDWPAFVRRVSPLRALWWLFSSARWAAVIIAFVAAVSLLGVLLPQVPTSVRGDVIAEAQWVGLQEGKFGPLTGWMHRVGLFDIFHARWFAVSLGLMVASTAVYIIGRVPGVWASVTRPRKRVPDRYFRVAPHRLTVTGEVAPDALEAVLRRHRYKVERVQEGEATYLFADRFPWAQGGTLLTHAAVILFILAAVVSRATGFEAPLFIAEGSTAPVFPVVSRPDQMQVRVLDTIGRFNERGQPLDYRSDLVIYQRGTEVKRCTTTVNSPCTYNHYRFSQAAYYGFGAEVQVRDLASGNVVYRETLPLWDTRPAPHLVVRDAAGGRVLFDDTPILGEPVRTLSDEGDVEAALARIRLDGSGERFVIGLRRAASSDDQRLIAFQEDASGVSVQLSEGERVKAGGLVFEFAQAEEVPALLEKEFPLPPGTAAGDGVLLQMGNAVYGTGNASEGYTVEGAGRQGPPVLSVLGVASEPLLLQSGESARVGGYE
ncbi:MAG: cytochrome c biogenesis protein ResB, partial [Chloroflexi bacterium]|nr:cytochrome c biogenesis protein ResB [Chloroflexota bacterium]